MQGDQPARQDIVGPQALEVGPREVVRSEEEGPESPGAVPADEELDVAKMVRLASGGSGGNAGDPSGGGNLPGGSSVAIPVHTAAGGACTGHPSLKSNGWAKGALSVQATWPSAPTAPCSLTATLTGKPAKKGKKASMLGTATTLTLLDGETVVVAQALKLSPVA